MCEALADRDSRRELEALFPRLQSSDYVVTSGYESTYNCVAFVAGDRNRRWEPEDRGGWFWPPELPREDFSLDNYIRCFEFMGFSPCGDAGLDDGIEKIAVFVDADGDFSHVARQLEDGWWSSKLGFYEDISHPALEQLFQGRPLRYGETIRYLSRRRVEPGPRRSGLVLPTSPDS